MVWHLRSAARSDIGKVRRRNEDAVLARDDVGLWAVADGLGGHAAGAFASALIVERLAALPRAGSVLDFIESIEDELSGVNAALRETARARAVDLIGSTVVVLVYDDRCAWCGWAGDSRAYRHEHGQLVQVTRDHLYGHEDDSVPWSGGPTGTQPAGGVLSRAVGAEATLCLDWATAANGPGTSFVLCSDGLNKEMADAEIAAACRHASPDAVLTELFNAALERGARDNVSAIVVQARGDAGAGVDTEQINRELRLANAALHRGEIDLENYRATRRRLGVGPPAAADAGGAAARAAPATTQARPRNWLARAGAWFRRR